MSSFIITASVIIVVLIALIANELRIRWRDDAQKNERFHGALQGILDRGRRDREQLWRDHEKTMRRLRADKPTDQEQEA